MEAQQVYDYARPQGKTVFEIFTEAWKWKHNSDSKGRVPLDAQIFHRNGKVPYYAADYVRHMTTPRPELPAQAVP